MKPETGIRQRELVSKKVVFSDSFAETKYTLPFVDAGWRVPFVVIDRFGAPPIVVAAKFHFDGDRLATPASGREVRRIETVPVASFDGLVHFDPWWAFRGVVTVDRTWLTAIFTTNIARPFHHKGKAFKIYDLRFTPDMDRLDALIAKDEFFRATEFHAGDLDLLALRTPAKSGASVAAAPSAKVL